MTISRLTALIVLALFALQGCVKPGSPATSSAQSTVLMNISGRDVTCKNFLESPAIRTALRNFILYEEVKAACSKNGIKADEAKVQQQIDQAKQSAAMQGLSWEDYLVKNGISESEYHDMVAGPMLFEELSKAMTTVTEDDIKAAWAAEDQRQQIIEHYASENHLPESEKAKLTIEVMHDFLKDQLLQAKMMSERDSMLQKFVDQATLDLSACIDNPQEAKKYEDLILNNQKKPADEKPAAVAPGAVPEAGIPAGETGAQGAHPGSQGGEAAPGVSGEAGGQDSKTGGNGGDEKKPGAK